MTDDHIQRAADVLSVGTIVATLAGWLPPIAALVAIIYTAIQIYESKTFKRFLNWMKDET